MYFMLGVSLWMLCLLFQISGRLMLVIKLGLRILMVSTKLNIGASTLPQGDGKMTSIQKNRKWDFGCLGRLAMKSELTIIFMSTRQSKCREQNFWGTVIHWYKSADTGSGLAWNNESFPLSLYKNGQHLDSPKAIPPKNTLVLCGMPGSSCEQSITVVSTVVSLLNTGTPQKTDMTMKKTPIWRCTSYWKWWFSSQPCLLEGIPHLFRCIKR